jgi:hypothetical protein
MKRLTSALVMTALLVSSAGLSAQQPEVVQRTGDYWYAYASRLPIGSTVRVRTADGKRQTGVLTHVDQDSITLQPRTRVPEPPQRIRFGELDQLEPKQNGSSVAKAVAIGAAVGAGTFLGILMLLAASWD